MRRALGLDGGGSGRSAGDKLASRHGGDRPLQLSGGGQPSSGGPNERRKHRFVQDGEIQYTVERRRSWTPGTGSTGAGPAAAAAARTNGNGFNHAAEATSGPVQALEATLRTEQATRERMERLLRDAQTKIHDLQTNLGHATLARTEDQQALTAARDRIEALEATNADLQAQLATAQSQLATTQTGREAAIRSRKETMDLLAVEREARAGAEQALQEAMTARLKAETVVVPRKTAKIATIAKTRAKVKEPQPVKWWIKSKPATKSI